MRVEEAQSKQHRDQLLLLTLPPKWIFSSFPESLTVIESHSGQLEPFGMNLFCLSTRRSSTTLRCMRFYAASDPTFMRSHIRTLSTFESIRVAPSQKAKFTISPVPPNPLGDGNYIRTAAALVIGFVLNFHTQNDIWHPCESEMKSWTEKLWIVIQTASRSTVSTTESICTPPSLLKSLNFHWQIQCLYCRKRIEVVPDMEEEMWVS